MFGIQRALYITSKKREFKKFDDSFITKKYNLN